MGKAIRRVWRWLASLQLAVCLIVLLAAVLAGATFLEVARGREYAQWFVYQSMWFFALLALLAVNILAATLVRFPWRKRRSFLVTHTGLLLLLAGSMQSFWGAIEGYVAVAEGESADRMTIIDRSQFRVQWGGSASVRGASFAPGPVDWPDGKTLDLGETAGMHLKVLKFFAHATVEESYQKDPHEQAEPAVQLALLRPDGMQGPTAWLTAGSSGSLRFGPLEIKLILASSDAKQQEFLHPSDPTAKSQPAVEFLHTPNGQLACRITLGGKYNVHGVVKTGDRMDLMPHQDSGMHPSFQLAILQYLPHARHEVLFNSVDPPPDAKNASEAAALVAATIGNHTQQLWLQRSDANFGQQAITTPQGTVTLAFGDETVPLGFSLRLLKFQRGLNPGGMGSATYASTVQVIDPRQSIDQTHEISMNNPLAIGRLTFYQQSYQESPHGATVSVLSVTYDPGLGLKYLGSLMICVGTALMFLRRVHFRKKLDSRLRGNDEESRLNHA